MGGDNYTQLATYHIKNGTLRNFYVRHESVPIREYQKDGFSLEESVKYAIKYCTENNILKEFLEAHSSEVFNMLLTEWNWDDALEVAREEGHEDGLEEGRKEAREEERQYFLELLNQGLTIEEIKQRLNQKEAVF